MISSKGRKVYQLAINFILIMVTLIMVLPLVLLFVSSITDENTLIANGYSFIPEKIGFEAYQYILVNATTIFKAYGVTVFSTVIGTLTSLFLVSLTAFPLSLRDLPGRRIFSFFIFFTMLFSGGLVPSYIMWTSFGIRNNILAYILPNFLMSAFNVILVRTFFQTSIPHEIYEAAKIDGSTYFKIFIKMALPLGKPIMVTVGLFTGLLYWNDWTNGLYYITDSELLSIQALLNKMIQDIQALAAQSTAGASSAMNIPQVSVRMAIAFVAVFPILVVYPFLQKYFASGITLGAVKG